MKDVTSLKTAVDRELLLKFFLTFSCFEYALKATGFFKRHPPNPQRPPRAEPDWDRFAVSLRDTFKPNATDALQRACSYFMDSPPKQQVILDDAVEWKTPVRLAEESDIEFLLRMVRCVRNNLFHGGKHNLEVHRDKDRNEKLLRCALTVLDGCLALAPDQEAAFRYARI